MKHRRGTRGTGLVEMGIVVALGGIVLIAALDVLVWSRRSERRVDLEADRAGNVALARAWIARDLDRLAGSGRALPLTVDPPDGRGGAGLALTLAGEPARRVRYRFDPVTGDLTRDADTEPRRRFSLGKAARVVFVKLDPSFAGGGGSRRGAYNNRLVFRLSAASDRQSFTLVGSSPFLVKASRDTFPFWRPGRRAE